MGISRYFAGGNTADGFVSFFPYILPATKCNHMYYIKGGPGVGKSSMMRQIGELMELKGYTVEYFDCSGDPDSIDAITISTTDRNGQNVKIGFIDATAPHSYDPVVPGARDTLISLGDYLDEVALEPYQNEIQGLVNKCSAIYRQCYAYLNAAGSVLRTCQQYEWNDRAVRAFANELLLKYVVQERESQENMSENTLSTTDKMAAPRHLFAEAYTHKGFISHLESLPCVETIAFDVPIGQSADKLLSALLDEMLMRGIEVIALHEPLRPALLAHLYLPKQEILFTSSPAYRDKISLKDLCQPNANVKGSICDAETFDAEAFNAELYEQLIEQAIQQLRHAKAAHDELETYYVKNMDFENWQKKLDDILQEIYNQIGR